MFTRSKKTYSFQWSFYTACVALALICIILTYLSLFQGPRLRRVEIATADLTTRSNEQMVVYSSQSLASVKKEQVTITPATDFSVNSSGDSISIQFNKRLQYDTTYHVVINGLRGASGNKSQATFRYSFKTNDPTIYYLSRGGTLPSNNESATSKKPDTIFSTSLKTDKETNIYSASKIQAFDVSGNIMAVTLVNDQQTNDLILLDTKTKKTQIVSIPGKGIVSQLHISPNQESIAFLFTSAVNGTSRKQYDNTLFKFNISSPGLVQPVKSVSGQALKVTDWQFAPDGTTIAARAPDSSVFLIDTKENHAPVPLGQFDAIGNFSYSGEKLSAESIRESLVINTIDHSRSKKTFEKIDGLSPDPQSLYLLPNSHGSIAQLHTYDEKLDKTRDYFLFEDDNEKNIIYTLDTRKSFVYGFSSSPNDQYLAIEQSRAGNDDTYDDYPDNSRAHSTSTDIVNIRGIKIKNIKGFNVLWN